MKKHLLAAVACLAITAPALAFDEKSAGTILSVVAYGPMLCDTSEADVKLIKRGVEMMIEEYKLDHELINHYRSEFSIKAASFTLVPLTTARLMAEAQGLCDALDTAVIMTKGRM